MAWKCMECGELYPLRDHYHIRSIRNEYYERTYEEYQPEMMEEREFYAGDYNHSKWFREKRAWKEWNEKRRDWEEPEIFLDQDRKAYVIQRLTRSEHEKMKLEFRMPFGRYRGEKLENLPLSYIEWLLENVNFNPDQEWLEKELINQQKLKMGEGIVRNR